MMRRESRWILAAIAFAVAAGILAWLMMRQDDGSVRLADGREFSVVAVTYGTNHVLVQGPPWARLMARYGSVKLAYRLGFNSFAGPSSALPSVMVWTRWKAASSNAPLVYASVADAHGTETEPSYVDKLFVWPKTQDKIAGWSFENYPRQQKEFTLRFYDYDLFRVRARQMAEVTVRNPEPVSMAANPAPTAPVTVKDKIIECSLVALRREEPPPRLPLTARNTIWSWAAAEFEFRENGRPTTGWTIKRLEAFSATGNYLSNANFAMSLVEGRRVVRFTGAFWTNELDWKLSVDVARTRDFPPETFWTLRLPVASIVGNTFRTNVQAVTGMRQFTLVAYPSNRAVSRPDKPELRTARLQVNYGAAGSDLHLDIASVADGHGNAFGIYDQFSGLEITPELDDQGRPRGNIFRTAARSSILQFDMELPLSTQFIDLTFAIHHSRKLEFRVQPEWASTNPASGFPPARK